MIVSSDPFDDWTLFDVVAWTLICAAVVLAFIGGYTVATWVF